MKLTAYTSSIRGDRISIREHGELTEECWELRLSMSSATGHSYIMTTNAREMTLQHLVLPVGLITNQHVASRIRLGIGLCTLQHPCQPDFATESTSAVPSSPGFCKYTPTGLTLSALTLILSIKPIQTEHFNGAATPNSRINHTRHENK
jgi:hypothetical protein